MSPQERQPRGANEMYLKEVIIDGFKSYATRTVVSGFDPAFNAITGLNGSGKSNVLDSICFVLGITNLSQVRASSLQELVYKNGQAGIRKATVTLVFCNADREKSPVGYENVAEITITRQIVVGGRNKYLINGHVAQPGRVQNLFHSVGLNVNNPHFLIMQGRITKVINMKPPEVLSMVEEAAGTKMYENKKEVALRQIEKKERKKAEIDALLEDSIKPSLKKLEEEKTHFMSWRKNNTDIGNFQRYLLAHEYWKASDILDKTADVGSGINQQIEEMNERISDWTNQKQASEKTISRLEKALHQRFGSAQLGKMREDVDEKSKLLVKKDANWKNAQNSLETEKQTLATLNGNISNVQETLQTRKNDLARAKNEADEAEVAKKAAAEKLSSAETAMLTGAASQGSQAAGTGSAVEQLEAAKKAASVAETEIASLNLRLAHNRAELEKKSGALAKDRAGVRELETEKKKAENAIAKAKLAVHELDFDADSASEMTEKLNAEKRDVAVLRERVHQLSARLRAFDFQYSDPYPGFNHRQVYGKVAKLIRVKDPKASTAIEVTAGGRLYQVVVDSDKTASDLLKRGQLKRRVTILPLNKISSQTLDSRKIQRAKQLVSSTNLALDLVGYDDEVGNAMKFVFGRTLVCKDMESANKITFDRNVYSRSVTLDGDVADPSGTMSGGSSARNGPPTLELLSNLSDSEAQLEEKQKIVSKLSSQLAEIETKARQFRQLTSELEMKQHEAQLLEQRLGESKVGRLLNEVQELEKQVSEIPQLLQNAKESLAKNKARAEELELMLQDTESAKKRAEEEAEAAMAAVKKEYYDAIANAQAKSNEYDNLVVQIEALEAELESLTSQRDDKVLVDVKKLEKEVELKRMDVEKISKAHEEAKSDLEGEQERINQSNKEISEVKARLTAIEDEIDKESVEKASLEVKLREAQRGRTQAAQLVESYDEKHTWIALEKNLFGVEGTDYEFTDSKLSTASKQLKHLEKMQEGLSRKLNRKVLDMFDTAEAEYKDLMKKKDIVAQDKNKIEKVIAELDKQKMVAVDKTWKKVNEDFGNIFSDLLPGTSAKLEPPEGQTIENGLEIRVAFGEVWKDSLSELSGGQRSLIALSLILAMLRFKPAPMYILDEVDAALDLSHTQNIGRMLRKHFTGSQFIVVSLKEGMFNNANVIFRTKFVDGVSTISRNVNNISFDELDKQNAKNVLRDVGKENVDGRRRGGQKRRALG